MSLDRNLSLKLVRVTSPGYRRSSQLSSSASWSSASEEAKEWAAGSDCKKPAGRGLNGSRAGARPGPRGRDPAGRVRRALPEPPVFRTREAASLPDAEDSGLRDCRAPPGRSCPGKVGPRGRWGVTPALHAPSTVPGPRRHFGGPRDANGGPGAESVDTGGMGTGPAREAGGSLREPDGQRLSRPSQAACGHSQPSASCSPSWAQAPLLSRRRSQPLRAAGHRGRKGLAALSGWRAAYVWSPRPTPLPAKPDDTEPPRCVGSPKVGTGNVSQRPRGSGAARPAGGAAGSHGWRPHPGGVRSPGQSQMEGLGRESRATAQGPRRPGWGRAPGGVQEDVGAKGLGADCGFCTRPAC